VTGEVITGVGEEAKVEVEVMDSVGKGAAFVMDRNAIRARSRCVAKAGMIAIAMSIRLIRAGLKVEVGSKEPEEGRTSGDLRPLLGKRNLM
jgi:hypothetical protein